MTKTVFTILFLFFITFQLSGQSFEWATQIASSDVLINGTVVDSAANVYAVGAFSDSAFFNYGAPSSIVLPSVGLNDVFITKTDSSGALVTVKLLRTGADRGNAIAYDDRGYIYITGSFSQTEDFDFGPASVIRTADTSSINSHFSYLAKYDLNWNLEWVNTFGAAGRCEGFELEIDKDGDVYVLGSFQNTVDFNPNPGTINSLTSYQGQSLYIAKYSSSGNYIWAKSIGLGLHYGDGAYSINADNNKNIFFSGTFNGFHDFDPGPNFHFLTSTAAALFVVKLDSLGNFVWATNTSGPGGLVCTGSSIDNSSNVYLTGFFQDTVNFDINQVTTPLIPLGRSDAFIFKVDSSGVGKWVNQFCPSASRERFVGVCTDNSNNIYVSGNINSYINQRSYIQKYDTLGNLLWNKNLTPLNGSWCYGFTIDVDNNDIYTTGYFKGTVDFDPGINIFNLTARSNSFNTRSDAFIQKMSGQPIVTGVEENLEAKNIRIQPNPTSEYFIINTNDFIYNDELRIYDLSGKLVMERTVQASNEPIIVSSLIRGVYLVRFGNKSAKLIVE